jgi:uncharacterized surface protein with fasciclin (FAS1) repeats
MKKKGLKRGLLSVALLTGLSGALALETNEEIDIVTALQEDENFSTLVSLLESTGLTEELASAGDITLFAPTNEAFEALGEDQLAMLSDDTAALTNILQLHVMQGEFPVLDLSRAEEGSLSSLSGEPYVIEQTASGLAVNDGDLVSTDVDNFYSNGVVHVISNVLVPASQAADDTADTGTDTTGVAVGALTDTNGDGTIDVNDVSDTNGDGVIDEQDYTELGITDTNGDGVIDEQDITATDSAPTDTTGDATTDETATDEGNADTTTDSATDNANTDMTNSMGGVDFTASDTDGDGFLSPEEFSTAFFTLYDTDGDGLMSQEEFSMAMSGMSGVDSSTNDTATDSTSTNSNSSSTTDDASTATDTDGDGELDSEDNDDGVDTDGDGSDTEQQ